MPVLYVNLSKQESVSKEPYASFLKKYDIIKDERDGAQIEVRVGNGRDGCFANGFYVDKMYYKNPRLRVDFAVLPTPKEGNAQTLVRVSYSYEEEDSYDLDFHLQRVRAIKKRAPYYYIPGATHFEFSSQIDDEYKLIFDAIVEDETKIPQVCCLLISTVIAIFSLDD